MKTMHLLAAAVAVGLSPVSAMAQDRDIEDAIQYCSQMADASAVYERDESMEGVVSESVDALADILNGRDVGYAVRSKTRRAEREYRAEQRQKRRVFNACMRDRGE